MTKFKRDSINEQLNSPENIRKLLSSLKEINQPVTKADLLLKTGLKVDVVDDSLEQLINDFPCRLQVDSKGEIQYDFDFSEIKPPKKTFFGKLKSALFGVLKAGKLLFKAWIAAMLLGYFWVYFPFIAGLTVAHGKTVIVYIAMGMMFTVLISTVAIFLLGPIVMAFANLNQAHLKKRNRKVAKKSKVKPIKLGGFFTGERVFFTSKSKFSWNIIRATFNYIFGEQKEKVDELDLEKLILNYIHNQQRRITISELVAITGWSIHRAETEMTKIMVNYYGEVAVNDQGVIIYSFPNLESSLLEHEKMPQFIWQRPLQLKAWNKNYIYENSLITMFNMVVLVVSGVCLTLNLTLPEDILPAFLSFINKTTFHIIPFIYSSLFFLIFVGNKTYFNLTVNRKKKKINRYNQLLNQAFQAPHELVLETKDEFYNQLVNDLEAEETVNEAGDIVLKFPYLLQEQDFMLQEQKLDFELLELDDRSREFDEDYIDGAQERLADNILLVKGDKKLAVYMKLIGKGAIIKLLALAVLLAALCYIFWGFLVGYVIIGIFGIPTLIGIVINLSNVLNTSSLLITPEHLEWKRLPFNIIERDKKYDIDEIESIFIKRQGRTSYRLCMSVKSKSYALILVENMKDQELLENLNSKILEFFEEL